MRVNAYELYDACAERAETSGLHAIAASVVQLAWSLDGATEQMMRMGRGDVNEQGCLESIGGELARLADGVHALNPEIRLLEPETENKVGALMTVLERKLRG